jgi:hypothetical protein
MGEREVSIGGEIRKMGDEDDRETAQDCQGFVRE